MKCVPHLFGLAFLVCFVSQADVARGDPLPWMDKSLSADERARLVVKAMTFDEKVGLLYSRFGVSMGGKPKPSGSLDSAGFNPGIPRLGVIPLQETDAELGVANPVLAPFNATALPSGLALGATFDRNLAKQAGAMVASEARALGFTVLLAGGANLIREPRGGRNFEYLSEDPLVTGEMVGASVAGIQSQGIVSTVKHFAVNAQENGRMMLNAKLSETAARESDLLAFELAIERGKPGSVMAAYNKVNGSFASENRHLLSDILKGDWAYPGWVMSDWSSVHSTDAAVLAGLDQESGIENDPVFYFGDPLKKAVAEKRVPESRVDDMVRRIMRSQFQVGLMDRPPRPGRTEDFAPNVRTAQTVAERSIVLLKNASAVLPLKADVKRLLVIGGHANIGVLSGGGSSQVMPARALRFEGVRRKFINMPKVYDACPPFEAIEHAFPDAKVSFVDGVDVAAAERAARDADAVIVFAEKWSNESHDAPDLALPDGQEALISAVAGANAKTIVVLETGGAVKMPWLSQVSGVVQAWFSGERGGQAIADVLSGRANPSGRLPITYPNSEDQLPRPQLPDRDKIASVPGEVLSGAPLNIDYDIEGADVGYRWYRRMDYKPLFPFGYGLSYTTFEHAKLEAAQTNGTMTVSLDVTNSGDRDGIDVPQIYFEGDSLARRLVGFESVALKPGETKRVKLTVDRRLTASYDAASNQWHVAAGRYRVSARSNAEAEGISVDIAMPDHLWSARHTHSCESVAGGKSVCVGSR